MALNFELKHLVSTMLESPRLEEGIAWFRKSYIEGELIAESGVLGRSVYFIESGQITVSIYSEDKKTWNLLTLLHPGDVFGESCLISAFPRIARVHSASRSQILEINGERLSTYLDDHPKQGYLLYKALFQINFFRLHQTNQAFKIGSEYDYPNYLEHRSS